MKRTIIALIMLACLAAASCTDASKERFFALGDKHRIELYSGGKMVREWTSTGKVKSEEGSDGYYFKDEASQKLVRVTGDLVITVIK